MKPLLPLAVVLAAGLLCGCPDAKMPKAPPKIPEPKAALQPSQPMYSGTPMPVATGQLGLAPT